ncbi:hypothetical protein ACLB2K_030155 [Fragaria x ananassa]
MVGLSSETCPSMQYHGYYDQNSMFGEYQANQGHWNDHYVPAYNSAWEHPSYSEWNGYTNAQQGFYDAFKAPSSSYYDYHSSTTPTHECESLEDLIATITNNNVSLVQITASFSHDVESFRQSMGELNQDEQCQEDSISREIDWSVADESSDDLKRGDAYYTDGKRLQLTKSAKEPELAGNIGRATYSEPFLLRGNVSGKLRLADFTTHFTFFIDSQGNKSYGDGFVFFLAPKGSVLNSILGGGGKLGLPVADLPGGNEYPFVAVEFDIYQNPPPTYLDPPYDHVGSMSTISAAPNPDTVDEQKSRNNNIPLLAVGLGVGLSILVAALALVWFIFRRKSIAGRNVEDTMMVLDNEFEWGTISPYEDNSLYINFMGLRKLLMKEEEDFITRNRQRALVMQAVSSHIQRIQEEESEWGGSKECEAMDQRLKALYRRRCVS